MMTWAKNATPWVFINCITSSFSLQEVTTFSPSITTLSPLGSEMLVTAETLAYMQTGALLGQLLIVCMCMAILTLIRRRSSRPPSRGLRQLRPTAPAMGDAWRCTDIEEGPPPYASLCRPMSPRISNPRPVSVHGTTVPRGAVGANFRQDAAAANLYQIVP